MVRITVAALLTFALSVYALGDPAGAGNVGNGAGKQFIGGQCLSTADCASQCCAFKDDGGVCSGVGAQFEAGKRGCGFGGGAAPPPPAAEGGAAPAAAPVSNAAVPAGFDTSVGDPNGLKNFGNQQGKQFITGVCRNNKDCASGCCAGLRGGAVCSGPGASTQNGKRGCGFSI